MKKYIAIASISGLLLGAFIMSLAMYLAGYRVPFERNIMYENGTALIDVSSADHRLFSKNGAAVMPHRVLTGGASSKGFDGYAEDVSECEPKLFRFEYDAEKNELLTFPAEEEFLEYFRGLGPENRKHKNINQSSTITP